MQPPTYPSQLPTDEANYSTLSRPTALSSSSLAAATATAVSTPSTSLLSSTLSISPSLLPTTSLSSFSTITSTTPTLVASSSHTSASASISTTIPIAATTLPSLTASPYSTSTMGLSSSTASATASGAGLLMQKPGDCELLGSFALFVQLALGGLAMMSLVWKRYRERPQRPVKIWFFDVSKQVFGSVLVHAANVFMAMLTSGRFNIKAEPGTVYNARSLLRRGGSDDLYQPNPCSWYLLNLAVDTTLGIPILIILLRIYTALAARTLFGRPRESIQSGNYGSPPKATWWFKQSMIYFCGLFGMKVVVLIIFVAFPWIAHIGDWALQWTEGNEQLQIIFVMMLFPLIMNAMQYYIIDSFIKKQDSAGRAGYDSDSRGHHSLVPDSDDSLLHSDDSSDEDPGTDSDSDSDPDLAKSASNEGDGVHKYRNHTGRTNGVLRDGEYDPTVDGDAPTLFESSSSGSRDTSIVSGHQA